ncbi:MAG: hypothetical protein R3B47_04970 [Bacteroidia bacterium]
MKKWQKYLLIGLALLLVLFSVLPMLLIPSPWVQRTSQQLPYPAYDVYNGIGNLQNWPHWAWPWSEASDIEVVWYDNTTGPMSGFYFDGKKKKTGSGVIELRETAVPTALFLCKIDQNSQQEHFSFFIETINDSVSLVEKEVHFDSGNLPWERLFFWMESTSKKKKAQKELKALGAFLKQQQLEKEHEREQ